MSDDTLRAIMEKVAATDGVDHSAEQLLGLVGIAKLISEDGMSIKQVIEFADSMAKGASRDEAMEFARTTNLAQIIPFPTQRRPN